MFRRLVESPSAYFVGAVVLLLVIIALQFDLRIPSRPTGTVRDLALLRNRGDLNVVFILVDTLRADRMSLYGYGRPTTPVIDDLANHGIVFERVIAQSSWTKTSMASLWTGTYPAAHGVLRFDNAIPHEATMPAEIFKAAGYRTVGIWRNGWVAPNFGFDQGFDVYYTPKAGANAQIQRHSPGAASIGGTDEDVFVAARDFLETFGQEKFFLYLHLMDLHQYVFDDDANDFGPTYSDAYDKSIDWTDRVIGALVDALDAADVLPRTVIAISSDHGEAFLEHGREGHAYDLYREVVEVPFLIIPPLILDRGVRVEQTIANVDVWPTLLDLVGLSPLQGADGRSMLPLVLAAGGAFAEPAPADLTRPVVSHLDQHWGGRAEAREWVSLTDGDSRLIVQVDRPDSAEFYDWGTDPREATNRSAENPPQLQPMLERIDRYRSDSEPPWGVESPTIEVDELRLNQLRALGYRVGS
ncbi:MAG: sulfatase [Deltaproteobacteria bacterium]|nr:sulfatase [Deltaproteobacteria bacterium]